MFNACRSYAGLLALLVVSVSCADTKPAAPLAPAPATAPTPPAPVPPPTPFPGAGIYAFASSPHGYPVQPYTATSRYVLYDDGTFALQLHSPSVYELRGRYTETDGRITFDFDWNAQNAGATGVFNGPAMTVKYNLMMSMSDFEDGVYVRSPPAPTN